MRAAINLSIVIVLLLIYAGAYCLMLKGRYVTLQGNNMVGVEEPYYAFGGVPSSGAPIGIGQRIARGLFVPANAIDKRVRPNQWQGGHPLPLTRMEDAIQANPR